LVRPAVKYVIRQDVIRMPLWAKANNAGGIRTL
jgi:hypothetical protein